jgi:tetratricopeptide (TPR) repeat protein
MTCEEAVELLDYLRIGALLLEEVPEDERDVSLNEVYADINRLQEILDASEGDGTQEFAQGGDWSGATVEDVVAATNQAEQLYTNTPRDSARRGIRAHNYGLLLWQRFCRTRDPDDLELSLAKVEEAVTMTPSAAAFLRSNNPDDAAQQLNQDDAKILNTLAAILDDRSQLIGDRDGLNRAVNIFEKLAGAKGLEDRGGQRAGWLSNLASSLQRRFEQSEVESFDDLFRAVQVSQEAVSCLEDEDPSVLSGAAQPLALLAEIQGDVDMMDQALAFLQRAQQAAPEEHPVRTEIGVNTALRIFQKSRMMRSTDQAVGCLQEAIGTATSALELAKRQEHPHQDHLHNMLGLFHYTHFLDSGLTSKSEAAQKALDHLQRALGSDTYTPVYRRVQAGRLILRLCCVIQDWETGYKAAVDAVDLIPKVTPWSLKTPDKQRLLSAEDIVGFGADAAAAALKAGKSAYEALSILERSRGSLAASVMDLRVDITALDNEHPELARRFISLRDELQMDTPGRHEANGHFDALVNHIRQQKGFERFLQPPDEKDLHEAVQDGPLVVLSASQYSGVNAFLIKQGNGVEILPLQGVSIEDLEERSANLSTLEGLEWLWTCVAKPILDALGYTELPQPPGEALPRIWWIPTGILTRFPLHAAGCHAAGFGDTVMDRAMSSYSSSIRTLLATRRRAYLSPRPRQVLLVAMASTPQHNPLALPAEETGTVEGLFASNKSFNCVSLRDRPCKRQVLQHLETSQFFHFAGHGKENVTDPSESLLLLHDWEDDPMTVDSILNLNIRNLFMAYLSACETGQVTKAKFRDESIHLAGAHQLAGFRHVIGTLWSVEDCVCVRVANTVYQVLLEGFERAATMTDELACRALHTAIREQRDEAVSGIVAVSVTDEGGRGDPRKASKLYDLTDGQWAGAHDLEAGGSSSLSLIRGARQHWIPYVHIGP